VDDQLSSHCPLGLVDTPIGLLDVLSDQGWIRPAEQAVDGGVERVPIVDEHLTDLRLDLLELGVAAATEEIENHSSPPFH
jgi:hypothetical protein